MTDPTRGFSIGAYTAIVGTLLGKGYQCVDYADADPSQPHIILRHDIDMSIAAAVRIADIEHALGVRATYFVLVRCELYNPFSAESQEMMRGILAHGHRLGLHFDASLYPDDLGALEKACAVECGLLEAAYDTPIEMVSFHRPSGKLLTHDQPIAGRAHAYQPAYFREIGYCSDSRGAWHHGHPLNHESVQNKTALQLLTHPIWWTRPDLAGPVEILDAFLEQRTDLLSRTLAENCEPYRAKTESQNRQ